MSDTKRVQSLEEPKGYDHWKATKRVRSLEGHQKGTKTRGSPKGYGHLRVTKRVR